MLSIRRLRQQTPDGGEVDRWITLREIAPVHHRGESTLPIHQHIARVLGFAFGAALFAADFVALTPGITAAGTWIAGQRQ